MEARGLGQSSCQCRRNILGRVNNTHDATTQSIPIGTKPEFPALRSVRVTGDVVRTAGNIGRRAGAAFLTIRPQRYDFIRRVLAG